MRRGSINSLSLADPGVLVRRGSSSSRSDRLNAAEACRLWQIVSRVGVDFLAALWLATTSRPCSVVDA
jgi:hypothetical protein